MDIVLKNPCLLPTRKLDDQKFEFIFLLDRSTSMRGRKLELAKQALTMFLHSLPTDCYFNIIAFDDTHTFMFPSSVKYSQTNFEQAKASLQGIHVKWGTNIYRPFEAVYAQPQIPGYLTQIFSLTDGCVSNRKGVIQLVASKMKHSRAFAIGVGSDVDRGLVEGIAKCGGGTAEFVTRNKEIQSKILLQLRVALKPALLKPILVS